MLRYVTVRYVTIGHVNLLY